jgi:hypothetical protein
VGRLTCVRVCVWEGAGGGAPHQLQLPALGPRRQLMAPRSWRNPRCSLPSPSPTALVGNPGCLAGCGAALEASGPAVGHPGMPSARPSPSPPIPPSGPRRAGFLTVTRPQHRRAKQKEILEAVSQQRENMERRVFDQEVQVGGRGQPGHRLPAPPPPPVRTPAPPPPPDLALLPCRWSARWRRWRGWCSRTTRRPTGCSSSPPAPSARMGWCTRCAWRAAPAAPTTSSTSTSRWGGGAWGRLLRCCAQRGRQQAGGPRRLNGAGW